MHLQLNQTKMRLLSSINFIISLFSQREVKNDSNEKGELHKRSLHLHQNIE